MGRRGRGVPDRCGGAPARGPENGPVHIVEFGDIRCRYCKKMLPVLDRVRATYPERVQTFYKW